MALAESRSLLVLSCPDLFGRSAQKRGIEFDKIGLSHPELVYSHRCASIAGPPRNFLTYLDQESPVLESGDRSSNLTLFSGTCVFSSVYANAGPSREACLSCLVRNLCILFGARKSVVPICPCPNLCILIGMRGARGPPRNFLTLSCSRFAGARIGRPVE